MIVKENQIGIWPFDSVKKSIETDVTEKAYSGAFKGMMLAGGIILGLFVLLKKGKR
jgi:hypothetical protein